MELMSCCHGFKIQNTQFQGAEEDFRGESLLAYQGQQSGLLKSNPAHVEWTISLIVTARNEVGARLCFHRRVWFCSRGGVSASVHAGIHPLWSRHPPEQTPLEQTSPPEQTPSTKQTPCSGHPPGSRHPTTTAEHAGRYGQCAGSTHPTGMQSCF